MIIGYVMAQWCSWNKVDGINEEIIEDWMNRSQSLIEVELTNQKRQTEHK
jgi:predicted DNA-binding protein (MmcQ/YjbR family)